MAVGVPGAYRSMSWCPRYSPELVAALLPAVWGEALDGGVERSPVPQHRNGITSQCKHVCGDGDVPRLGWAALLGDCVVDGDYVDCKHVHSGHAGCGACACVSASTRVDTDNRASDLPASIADVQRAWTALKWYFGDSTREALMMRFALGFTEQEIALHYGVTQQAVSQWIANGLRILTDFLNGEW